MPPPERPEYNPFILGFVEERGPVFIPLQEARERYGHLPSEFAFVPAKDGRAPKKGLNLAVGKLLTEVLGDGRTNLKGAVSRYFQSWHRDLRKEFNVRIDPLQNLNDHRVLLTVLTRNRFVLDRAAGLSLRKFLSRGYIRKDILNSIPDEDLPAAADRILSRKIKSLTPGERREEITTGLKLVRSHETLRRVREITGFAPPDFSPEILSVYADEIAAAVTAMSGQLHLEGVERLENIRPDGVSFELASRDLSYLQLGKQTGDCTADKKPFQADHDVENIYWTVFPWILDRNYQILKVYLDGEFVMKAHLLPLFVIHERKEAVALTIDAVETVRVFRDDLTGQCRDDLLTRRDEIFSRTIAKIRSIAEQMGISCVYAEKFSNTAWVRDAFNAFPEIYLPVDRIIKLDDLEDVYYLACELGERWHHPRPSGIFMEIQMKNTSLLPRVSKKMAGVKSFAVITGDPDDGMPMKRVFGI